MAAVLKRYGIVTNYEEKKKKKFIEKQRKMKSKAMLLEWHVCVRVPVVCMYVSVVIVFCCWCCSAV